MDTLTTEITVETADEKKPYFLKRVQKRITGARSSYLAFCFLIPAVLTYLLYLAMEIHPFGNGSVLVLDLNAQYVYFFEAFREFVHGDADLLYSFSRALGGEFIGMYAYYLASPLSLIVALFPKGMMLEALLTMFLIKSGLCGLTFGFYLHKNSKNTNRVMVIAFSAMYSLCAFAVVHQNNTMWTDALILLPLLTYGIEQLVKFGKYKLFVITLALTIWCNYYIGYMVCIYVALYFFYYLLAYGGKESNPREKRAHFIRSLIRIAFFSLLAVAISAFIILGAYYSLGFGKDEFSNPDWTLSARFNILDFFTKFLPGSYDTVRPEGLPFVYTGLLTLILVPVYFMSRKISSREKVASVAFIGVFCLSFIASTLDLLWHGFQAPNWLNNRYSFMLCFFLLVLAYKGFGNLRRVSEKFILCICAFIILFVAVCEKQTFETYVESDSKLMTLECVWLSVIATVVLLVLLCLLIKNKNVRKRENLAGILAAVVCIELYCSSLACMVKFDEDVVYSNYSGYNEFITDLGEITDLVHESDTSFYRMEKNRHRTVNDNMALGIRGLSNSTSTLNRKTIDFLDRMGYASVSHWSKYLGGTPVNDSLLGIKYIVDTHSSETCPLYYTEAYSTMRNVAYLNPYALSIAYGVDGSVRDFNLGKHDSHFLKLNDLVGTMLGENTAELFIPIPIGETKIEDNGCETTTVAGHLKYTAELTEGAYVTLTVVAPSDGELFFFAPSDYTRVTKMYVNNSNKGEYFGSDSTRIISLGVFEEGDVVRVKLELEDEDLYLAKGEDYFYYLDTEAFKSAFERLGAGPQFEIDEGYTDSHLSGSITTTDSDTMILSTIPFDKGWKVLLDGEEIETYETLDALMAFDIPEAGEHTLEMIYSPRIYTVGMTVSIAGIVIFIAICLLELISKTLFRKIFRIEKKKVEDTYWVLEDFDIDAYEETITPPLPKKKVKSVKEYLASIKSCKDKLFSKKADTSEDKTAPSDKDSDNTQNGGN